VPPPCSVCTHPRQEAVDRDLLDGRPVVQVAAEYQLAATSIRRHRDRHLGPKLARALARREDVDAESLAAHVLGLYERTLVALAKAEAQRDWTAVRGLIREARENVVVVARLAGILDTSAHVSIDLRRQTAVLASLSEDELRALARTAIEESGEAPAVVGSLSPPLARPHETDVWEAS
jgi:hypothetical protein